jgi:hypothetical protein
MEALLLGATAIFVSEFQRKPKGLFSFIKNTNNNTCQAESSDILKQRTLEGLTEETKALIQLITLQNDVFPVGSFRYKAHRYPGDIDIFEPIKACCDKESASKAIASKIQGMAREILTRPDVYLGDFKAGLDDRFLIPSLDSAQNILDGLLKQNLITTDEYKEALAFSSLDDLQEYMRKFRIVRWTLEEILSGVKVLPNDIKLTLSDALTHKSVVKIDLWAPLNGNYNEITNFFLVVMIDKEGKEVVLNEELGDRLINLNHDIIKYGSKEHRNSLKLAKRLWNRALFLGDTKMPKILYPLFQSGCNSLNQIAGESEVIRMMIERLPNPPIETLLLQIDGFRRRITDVFDVDFNPRPMFVLIKNIISSNVDIIAGLLELERLLKKTVERHANNFLNCNIPNIDELIFEAKTNEYYIKNKDKVKNSTELEDII